MKVGACGKINTCSNRLGNRDSPGGIHSQSELESSFLSASQWEGPEGNTNCLAHVGEASC